MAKAGVSHDCTIEDASSGSPKRGFMFFRGKNGKRPWVLGDFQTLQPRQLGMGDITQAEFPADAELTVHQEDWIGGIGGTNHRLHPLQIASGTRVETSIEGKIRLSRDVTRSDLDATPTVYNPSGFALVGGEVWAFIGRDVYSWDYANDQWDKGTVPVAAARIYRNGVIYQGNTYVPSWADDAGSGGSYTADDEPIDHLYKADADANWTVATGDPRSFKYFAVADGKLWGGYVGDAADSTINTGQPVFVSTSTSNHASVSSITTTHTTPAGTNRCLIVGVSVYDPSGTNAEPTGITYNGSQDFTKITEDYQGSLNSSLWRLVAPATESSGGADDNNAVVISFAGSRESITIGFTSWTNVDQTSPVGTGVTAKSSGTTTPTVNVSATKGGVVVDNVAASAAVTGTGASQTQRWNGNPSGSLEAGTGSSEPAGSTDATVTMSHTISSAAWVTCAVEINPNLSTSDTTLVTASDPSSAFSAGDVLRIDSELMLVSATSSTTLTVVRGYRGTVAAAHEGLVDIYEITENVHHIRSTTDGTSAANWSSAVEVGDSSAPITALLGSESELIICKTDGIYKYDGNVTELRPELATMRHPDNFRGAFMWNDKALLPLGGGGLWEYDTRSGVISDLSFDRTTPSDDRFFTSGEVVAMHGNPNRLFVLIHERRTGIARYHLLGGDYVTVSGTTDFRWSHLASVDYSTATDIDHAAMMAESTPSGTNIHRRVLFGVESTGSASTYSKPYFYPDEGDDDANFSNDGDEEAITVEFDFNLPRVDKLFSSIDFTTANCGSGTNDHDIEVQYSIDGAAYADVSASKLDFTIRAQLRPKALKYIPVQFYVADHVRNLKGAVYSSYKGDLDQLRTWSNQAAEVTLTDPNGTSRDVIFLPGRSKEEEVSFENQRRPEIVFSALLLDVDYS